MKKYEVQVEGYHTPLEAEQIRDLFGAGRLRRSDRCREAGAREWRTVDELFPLLKYDSSGRGSGLSPAGQGRTQAAFEGSDEVGDAVRPMSSALKAGWICFGIALSISWFFPFGHAFFSIAVIMAVVAMCTHQVNRGLALLISSFVASGLCVLIFFTLVLGTLGVATGAALKQARANVQRQEQEQRRTLNQMSAASQQLQTAMTNSFATEAPPRSAPIPQLQQAANSFSQQQQYDLAMQRQREADARKNEEQSQRARNVYDAERQRDLAKARDQRLQQLQNSIDWNDRFIRQMREQNVSPKYWEDQRDSLLQQKAKIQGY